MKFKIGDWVSHTTPIFGPKPEPRRGRSAACDLELERPQTGTATYVGRVKKVVIEEEGVKYFVVFGPDHPWVELTEKEMRLVGVDLHYVPTSGPADDWHDEPERAKK